MLWGCPQLYQRRLRRYFTHFRWRLGRRGSIAGTNYEFNVFDVLFCVLFFSSSCGQSVICELHINGAHQVVPSLRQGRLCPSHSRVCFDIKTHQGAYSLTELQAGMKAKGDLRFDFRDSDTECQLDKHCENPPDSEIGVDKYQLRFETTCYDDG